MSWVCGCLFKCVVIVVCILLMYIYIYIYVCINGMASAVCVWDVYVDDSGWNYASLWNASFELSLCRCWVPKSCVSFASLPGSFRCLKLILSDPVELLILLCLMASWTYNVVSCLGFACSLPMCLFTNICVVYVICFIVFWMHFAHLWRAYDWHYWLL